MIAYFDLDVSYSDRVHGKSRYTYFLSLRVLRCNKMSCDIAAQIMPHGSWCSRFSSHVVDLGVLFSLVWHAIRLECRAYP